MDGLYSPTGLFVLIVEMIKERRMIKRINPDSDGLVPKPGDVLRFMEYAIRGISVFSHL